MAKTKPTSIFYPLILLICISLTISACDDDSEPVPVPEPMGTIQFISSAPRTTFHNREYIYRVSTEITEGDTVRYSATVPDWMNFNDTTGVLSGIADWSNLNKSFGVMITATNLIDTVKQLFSVAVELGEIICNSPFGDTTESEYILPFEVGEEFLLTQSYCTSNPAAGHHNWFAYDFEMDIGETIIASRAGEVIFTKSSNTDEGGDCSGGKENFVFIEQTDGTVMQYVHLKQGGVSVNVGNKVEQGDVIGFSGNSGCSSGPHLHTNLFRDRTNFDRQSTLPLNYSNADGPLDSNNGLVFNSMYKALPF